MAETKKRPDPAAVREKESLSPEEVAVVLNCGRTMAYKLIADGVIRSFRSGGSGAFAGRTWTPIWRATRADARGVDKRVTLCILRR